MLRDRPTAAPVWFLWGPARRYSRRARGSIVRRQSLAGARSLLRRRSMGTGPGQAAVSGTGLLSRPTRAGSRRHLLLTSALARMPDDCMDRHATPSHTRLLDPLECHDRAACNALVDALRAAAPDLGDVFILTGLGRFVEEAWRGEPQTPGFLRLRLYQWAAITSVIGGALMTALGHSAPTPVPRFAWDALLLAAVFGLAVCIGWDSAM